MVSVGTQTTLTRNTLDSESKEQVSSLQLDNKRLFAKVKELREKIKSSEINEDFFRNNDEKMKYYTGLPNWNLLLIVDWSCQFYIKWVRWQNQQQTHNRELWSFRKASSW